jgi:hypothetical protein
MTKGHRMKDYLAGIIITAFICAAYVLAAYLDQQ